MNEPKKRPLSMAVEALTGTAYSNAIDRVDAMETELNLAVVNEMAAMAAMSDEEAARGAEILRDHILSGAGNVLGGGARLPPIPKGGDFQ